MISTKNRVDDTTKSYKMTEEERLKITNELKDAIEFNKKNSQKRNWDSKVYKEKYGL